MVMVFQGYCVDACEIVAKNKVELFCTVSFSGIVLSRKFCMELERKRYQAGKRGDMAHV